eukprot:jgi/Mesen1/2208/ME000152S01289
MLAIRPVAPLQSQLFNLQPVQLAGSNLTRSSASLQSRIHRKILRSSVSPQIHRRQAFQLSFATLLASLSSVSPTTMAAESGNKDPQNFQYTHLWVSKDGETHIKEATLSGFDLKKYAEKPQYVKEGPSPSKIVFTQLDPGLEQDLHSCPQVQFVVCLSGSWYVKTTDGTKKVFVPGDVLFQDNTADCPSEKQPKHFSGVVGDGPNQQLIIQVDRKPEVDNPGSL